MCDLPSGHQSFSNKGSRRRVVKGAHGFYGPSNYGEARDMKKS
jgi:hypothetical protein